MHVSFTTHVVVKDQQYCKGYIVYEDHTGLLTDIRDFSRTFRIVTACRIRKNMQYFYRQAVLIKETQDCIDIQKYKEHANKGHAEL
jgi:hypothetical protein